MVDSAMGHKGKSVSEAASAPVKRGTGVHRWGPQRDPDIDSAVLTATRELLVERGYQGVSIDAIAMRAGVGRPTVYRRWRTKAHVVHDAVYPSVEAAPLASGGLADSIAALVSGAYALYSAGFARAGVPGLMSETRSDAELRDKLVTGQLEPFRATVRSLIEKGIEHGEVRADADVDSVVDAIAGSAIFALGVRDAHDPEGHARRLTDLVLRGITAG